MERHFWSHSDLMALVKFLILLVLSYLKSAYPSRFTSFLRLITVGKYFLLYGAGTRSALVMFHVLFLASQLASVSLFLSFLQEKYGLMGQLLPVGFLDVFAIVSIVFLIKWIVQILFGYILGISDQAEKYVFEKQSYFCYSSLLLYVFSLFYIENFSPSRSFTIMVGGLFLGINFFGTLSSFFKRIKDGNILYFLLYICILEIVPLIIGIRTIIA